MEVGTEHGLVGLVLLHLLKWGHDWHKDVRAQKAERQKRQWDDDQRERARKLAEERSNIIMRKIDANTEVTVEAAKNVTKMQAVGPEAALDHIDSIFDKLRDRYLEKANHNEAAERQERYSQGGH